MKSGNGTRLRPVAAQELALRLVSKTPCDVASEYTLAREVSFVGYQECGGSGGAHRNAPYVRYTMALDA